MHAFRKSFEHGRVHHLLVRLFASYKVHFLPVDAHGIHFYLIEKRELHISAVVLAVRDISLSAIDKIAVGLRIVRVDKFDHLFHHENRMSDLCPVRKRRFELYGCPYIELLQIRFGYDHGRAVYTVRGREFFAEIVIPQRFDACYVFGKRYGQIHIRSGIIRVIRRLNVCRKVRRGRRK